MLYRIAFAIARALTIDRGTPHAPMHSHTPRRQPLQSLGHARHKPAQMCSPQPGDQIDHRRSNT